VRRAGAQEEIALHALDEVVALRHERLTANAVPDPALIVGFAVDPVCGMTVDTSDAAHTAVHEGTTYFFCCAGCAERFAASPAQFASASTR
jgi:YHS domain-containing protein